MGNIIWNKTGYIHADPRQGPPAPQWSFASAETPFFTVFSYSGKQKTLEIAALFTVIVFTVILSSARQKPLQIAMFRQYSRRKHRYLQGFLYFRAKAVKPRERTKTL